MKERPKNKKQNKDQSINETKSWFFKKINKINKTLANLSKMRREKTQTSKIRNIKRDKGTNTKEIRELSDMTLRTNIPINLKILKKWRNF
jgi:hypothetical protein